MWDKWHYNDVYNVVEFRMKYACTMCLRQKVLKVLSCHSTRMKLESFAWYVHKSTRLFHLGERCVRLKRSFYGNHGWRCMLNLTASIDCCPLMGTALSYTDSIENVQVNSECNPCCLQSLSYFKHFHSRLAKTILRMQHSKFKFVIILWARVSQTNVNSGKWCNSASVQRRSIQFQHAVGHDILTHFTRYCRNWHYGGCQNMMYY